MQKYHKKAQKMRLNKIDDKVKTITEKLSIDDRVETTVTKEAFLTLKEKTKQKKETKINKKTEGQVNRWNNNSSLSFHIKDTTSARPSLRSL